MSLRKGYRWRSSRFFIISTITAGFFSHLYLYGFIVPILPYMLETRVRIDPSHTQSLISGLLAVHAFASVIASPLVGHYADKTSNRKKPLLLGLYGELVCTVVVAVTTNLSLFFIGRIGQAVSGITLWIVGFATLADTVGVEHMGATVGLVLSFTSVGTFAGPMIAGVLLEKAGYWYAWGSAIAVLLVDILMRVTMVENPLPRPGRSGQKTPVSEADSLVKGLRGAVFPKLCREPQVTSRRSGEDTTDEQTALLAHSSSETSEKAGIQFYTYMFKQPRFVAAMYLYLTYGIILASLETTLPLHIKEKFNWGSYPAGMMFLALQAPSIPLSMPFGWLRDRFGSRYPTGIAFLLIAPDLCLLGIPGDKHFLWAQSENGKIVYVTAVVVLGVLTSMLNGVGSIEGGLIVEEIQMRYPGIFGPQGGSSRIYSLAAMSWTLGMLIGPIVSGFLRQGIGYAYMNLVLAIVSLVSAGIAFTFLGSKRTVHDGLQESEQHTGPC